MSATNHPSLTASRVAHSPKTHALSGSTERVGGRNGFSPGFINFVGSRFAGSTTSKTSSAWSVSGAWRSCSVFCEVAQGLESTPLETAWLVERRGDAGALSSETIDLMNSTARGIPLTMFGQEPDLEDAWPQFSSDKQALSKRIVSNAV